jgi:hypothetical protein
MVPFLPGDWLHPGMKELPVDDCCCRLSQGQSFGCLQLSAWYAQRIYSLLLSSSIITEWYGVQHFIPLHRSTAKRREESHSRRDKRKSTIVVMDYFTPVPYVQEVEESPVGILFYRTER